MFKIMYRVIRKIMKQKKIKNILNINKFLDSFDYNINLKDLSYKNLETEKYIWQLWSQGENNAPEIIKKCLESVKKYCPDGYKIIVLDKDNVNNYINIDNTINEKYIKGIISNTHFSDYIRTCLLDKYGGIWIDSSVLLTNKIPAEILKQEFFVFKNPFWFNYKKVPSENLFKIFLTLENTNGFYGSSWFILSKRNNPIIKLQKSLLEQYWKRENKLCNYFLYHFFISKSLIKNIYCKETFENMISLSNREPHILQNMLNEDFDEQQFEEIKLLTSINKLTYKFNKIENNSFLSHILNDNEL